MISMNKELKEEENRVKQAREAYLPEEDPDEEEAEKLLHGKKQALEDPEYLVRSTEVINEYQRLANLLLAIQFIILAFTF